MDLVGIQWIPDPATILLIILTLIAFIGRFIRVWLITLILFSIVTAISIVIVITIAQVIGADDMIRYYITSTYTIFSIITLTLRDIILFLILMVSFQISLAIHTLNIESLFQNRLLWIPRKKSSQFEMEHTLDKYSPNKDETFKR